MAIIYICKDCKGKGKVQQRVWIVHRTSVCRTCGGTGKRKYAKAAIFETVTK